MANGNPTITEDIMVKTKNGFIRGAVTLNENEKKYYSFLGIPYAKPPIGARRFLAPSPAEPWAGVFDATQTPVAPWSIQFDIDKIAGTEDCLFVNVFTPNLAPEKPYPVMFWIGGWVYSVESLDFFDPDLLVDKDVVLVNCSFRLGPFGFLSTCQADAPGNCGLKDTAVALRWVHDNINVFGGDSNNVTVFGSGSGADMTHLFLFSPMTKGLFHKAIVQSGSALKDWALTRRPIFDTFKLASELGITSTSPSEVVEKLRLISAIDLMHAFHKLIMEKYDDGGFIDLFDAFFKPCIEIEFEGQPAFLKKSPYSLLRSGKYNKVPMIIGNNKSESTYIQFLETFNKVDFSNFYKRCNENINLLVPRALSIETNKSKNIGHRLLKYYFKDNIVKEETAHRYFQYLTDYYFLHSVNKTVKLHSKFSEECPIYYYIFDFVGDWEVHPKFGYFNVPCYCGELPYLFQMKSQGKYDGSRDSVRTRDRMIKLWTNFCKFGNPTPDEDDDLLQVSWDPVVDQEKLQYLNIGSELTKGRNPFFDRMSFWDELLDDMTFLRISTYFEVESSSKTK